MKDNELALDIENLSYTYRKDFTLMPVHALKNLCIKVAQGECFGFLGPNGAGKTTTIKCILRLVRHAGNVFISGLPNHDVTSRRSVGYVPEQPYFYDNLRVRELMEVYATLGGVKSYERKAAVDKALERVSLIGRDNFAVRSLSKGLMQRLAMAQAIVARPKLLILDEPFSGLDPIGRQEFRELFFALKQEGTTLFLCSHILSDIEFLCEQAAIVAKGTLRGVIDLATRRKDSQRQVEVVLDRVRGESLLSKIPDGAKIRTEGDSVVVICDHHEHAAPFLKAVIEAKTMALEQYRPAQLNLTQLFRDLVQD